jgi:hypothetical protein
MNIACLYNLTDLNKKYTLTTEAPVANFFPSFFEASLSFTPKIQETT